MSDAILNAVLRTDFKAFIEKVFLTVDQGAVYKDNWHIDAVAERLRRVQAGEIRHLLITQPPRTMKSICVSVALVAWLLGQDPAKKIICVSYSASLASELASQCRKVMESEWYRAAFPDTRLEKATEVELRTTRGGYRHATSIGGTLTGRGADYIIVDDPLKAEDGRSESARRNAIDWFKGTLISRLNEQDTGRIIIVMQRLHEDDLAGHVLDSGTYDHLNLPAIATEDMTVPIGPGKFHRYRRGDLLHPEQLSDQALAHLKLQMGSSLFSAQYQQTPLPAESDLLHLDWFKTWDKEPEGLVIQSWDTASSISETGDYSVCITAIVQGRRYYIVDVLRQRLAYPDLKRRIHSHAKHFGAGAILIERAGSGMHLVDEFCRECPPDMARAIGIQPRQDKLARFEACTAIIERGDLLLPAEAKWLAEFKSELMSFPRGRHDDQVDALSQMLNWADNRVRAGLPLGVNSGLGPYGIVPAGQVVRVQDLDEWE